MNPVPAVLPGDVLAVSTGNGWGSWWIRMGAALHGQPNLSNHIAVVHHTDAEGTVWGIEGRPGGVGWADCGGYLRSVNLLANAAQPKTAAQRASVCATMQALLGTAYDWAAVVSDGAADLGIRLPGWSPDWTGTVPGHVVCSSAAQYAYLKNGLACPPGDRGCQPSDWDSFIINEGWLKR